MASFKRKLESYTQRHVLQVIAVESFSIPLMNQAANCIISKPETLEQMLIRLIFKTLPPRERTNLQYCIARFIIMDFPWAKSIIHLELVLHNESLLACNQENNLYGNNFYCVDA